MSNDTPICKYAKQLHYGINCTCKDVTNQCPSKKKQGAFYNPMCPFYHHVNSYTLELAPIICKYYDAIELPLTVEQLYGQLNERLDKLEYNMDHLLMRFKFILKEHDTQ